MRRLESALARLIRLARPAAGYLPRVLLPARWQETAFRALVENSPDIITRFDRQLRHVYVSPAIERETGLPAEAFIGRTHLEFAAEHGIEGPFASRCTEALSRVLATGRPEVIRIDFPHGEGTDCFECRIVPERSRGGAVESMLSVGRNITAQLRAEEALRLTRAQQEALLDNLPDMVWLKDAGLRYLVVNAAMARECGMPREQILGRTDREIFPDPLARKYREDDRRVLATGRRLAAEETFLRPDGSVITVETIKTPFRDSTGECVGTVGISRDLTERKRTERERLHLLQREQRARARAETAEQRSLFLAEASELFAASLDYAATLDCLAALLVPRLADCCIIYRMDDGGERPRRIQVLHVDPAADARLREWLERVPPGLDALSPAVTRVLRSGEPEFVPFPATEEAPGDDAGPPGLCCWMVVPLPARGRVLGAVSLGAAQSFRCSSVEDLRLAAEVARRAALAIDNALLFERVQKAVRDREQVLQVVSHDLRNPLATILLNASGILESAEGERLTPWVREMLESVALSAEQANRLIQDLMDVAHLDADRLSMNPSTVAVAALLGRAVTLLQPLAEAKQQQLRNLAGDDLPPIRADGQRILQVFSNLVGNSIKFTPRGGTITLDAHRVGEEVEFSVSDTGPGIPAEQIPFLFDRLWHDGRTARARAGLGLAITRGIVSAHGGRIWVESEAGRGSTFRFTIPLFPGEERLGSTEPPGGE